MQPNIHVVFVVLYKPKDQTLPQVLAVCSDERIALRNVVSYMGDFDPPWADLLMGEPVTEERVLGWSFAPGDYESFEFERDDVWISASIHEIEHPLPEDCTFCDGPYGCQCYTRK